MKTLGLLLVVLLSSTTSIAQQIFYSDTLELFHPERQKEHMIPAGDRVGLRLGDDSKFRGRLERVAKDSIQVEGKMFAFTDINFIGHRTWKSDVGGFVMMGIGAGLLTTAVISATGGGREEGLVTSGLIGALGLGIGSLGPGLWKDGKRYYLDSDWKIPSRYQD
jgi:hypothetical protein